MRESHLGLSLCQTGFMHWKENFFLLKCIMLFSSLQCYKLICHLNMLAVALSAKSSG